MTNYRAIGYRNKGPFVVVGRVLGSSSIRSLGTPTRALKSKNRSLGNYELTTF